MVHGPHVTESLRLLEKVTQVTIMSHGVSLRPTRVTGGRLSVKKCQPTE